MDKLLDQQETKIRDLEKNNLALTLANDYLISQMQHFVQAIEQGPVAVVITNANNTIEYVNSKFEEITGYSGKEVFGKNPRILKSGETPPQTYGELWSTLKAKNQWTGVFHNKKKSGELFWERAVISAVLDSAGQISHYVAVKEDITLHREMERAMEEQKLKYHHQSKMASIGMLASSILHEVSNPIAAIRGLANEIVEAAQTEKSCLVALARTNLNMILEQVDRLTQITHEISDFTSRKSDEMELLDINGLVRGACRLVQFDKRWNQVSLTVDCDSQLPAIYGHKNQLSHMLVNLLINAADALGEKSDAVHLVDIKTTSCGNKLMILISDNGIGMSPEVQSHAFEAFYTTKPPGKGTGLGLSLCKSIVDSHDGAMEIDSSQGIGTTIRIILPINFDYNV